MTQFCRRCKALRQSQVRQEAAQGVAGIRFECGKFAYELSLTRSGGKCMDGLSSGIDVLVQVHQHLAIVLCMCRCGKAGERVKVISGRWPEEQHMPWAPRSAAVGSKVRVEQRQGRRCYPGHVCAAPGNLRGDYAC